MRRYISPLSLEAPTAQTSTKFDLREYLPDIITISYQPVKGFWFCKGSNFAISHKKMWSLLTRCCTIVQLVIISNCWLKKYGLSNLILTLTEQKLIKWSLKLYMSLLLRFFSFFKIQKTWLFTFFALLHTFSRTMVATWPTSSPLITHTTLFTKAWQIQSIDISVRKENKYICTNKK